MHIFILIYSLISSMGLMLRKVSGNTTGHFKTFQRLFFFVCFFVFLFFNAQGFMWKLLIFL